MYFTLDQSTLHRRGHLAPQAAPPALRVIRRERGEPAGNSSISHAARAVFFQCGGNVAMRPAFDRARIDASLADPAR